MCPYTIYLLKMCPYTIYPCMICPYTIYPCMICLYTIYPCKMCIFTIYPCMICPYTIYQCKLCIFTIYPCMICPYTIYPCKMCIFTIYPCKMCLYTIYPFVVQILKFVVLVIHVRINVCPCAVCLFGCLREVQRRYFGFMVHKSTQIPGNGEKLCLHYWEPNFLLIFNALACLYLTHYLQHRQQTLFF